MCIISEFYITRCPHRAYFQQLLSEIPPDFFINLTGDCQEHILHTFIMTFYGRERIGSVQLVENVPELSLIMKDTPDPQHVCKAEATAA